MKSVAALILLLGLALSVEAVGVPVYQYPEEWGLWKSQHAKEYVSDLEELERHSVWLSNKEYIDQHNANAELFGFTLAMNHLGDLVSRPNAIKLYSCLSLIDFSSICFLSLSLTLFSLPLSLPPLPPPPLIPHSLVPFPN